MSLKAEETPPQRAPPPVFENHHAAAVAKTQACRRSSSAPQLVAGKQLPVRLQNGKLPTLFIGADGLINIAVVQHLAKRLGDLHLIDFVLFGNALDDFFRRRSGAELPMHREIIEVLRNQLVIRSVNFRVGGNFMISTTRRISAASLLRS